MSGQVDYDRLLRMNLERVFGERDATARMVAIRELYEENAVLNEPHASATGHAAISDAVTALLDTLPLDFVFTAAGPATGHHELGRLSWRGGPRQGPSVVQGMDVAQFKGGRIQSLHVFLEPRSA